MRPPSSAIIASLKPSPSLPSRFVRRDLAVLEGEAHGVRAAQAHLVLVLADDEARRAALDDEARRGPCCPAADVRAQTTITPAYAPEVIHCLLPLSTQLSPLRTAVVRSAPGSEPACGSESANAPDHRLARGQPR